MQEMLYWEFCMRAQTKHVFCRDITQAIEWLFIMRVAYDISIISNCGKLLKIMSRMHSSAMWGRLHPQPTAMYVVCATNHHKFYDKVVILGHLNCSCNLCALLRLFLCHILCWCVSPGQDGETGPHQSDIVFIWDAQMRVTPLRQSCAPLNILLHLATHYKRSCVSHAMPLVKTCSSGDSLYVLWYLDMMKLGN